jgi:hypothetical protein
MRPMKTQSSQFEDHTEEADKHLEGRLIQQTHEQPHLHIYDLTTQDNSADNNED